MFFGGQKARIRKIRYMIPILFMLVTVAILIAASACSAAKGGIVILENPDGKGFAMDFRVWSSYNKCGISLDKGDTLQIEVACEEGEIALAVMGKNGSEPYTGKNLKSVAFTVTVVETDKYVVRISGKNASGKVTVRKVENTAD